MHLSVENTPNTTQSFWLSVTSLYTMQEPVTVLLHQPACLVSNLAQPKQSLVHFLKTVWDVWEGIWFELHLTLV